MDVKNPGPDAPKYPQKVYQDEFSEVYFKQDNAFFTPRAKLQLIMYLDKDMQY